MSARKPFKPLDETLLDDAADRVAAAKNIPTLTRPQSAPYMASPSDSPPVTQPAQPPQPEAKDERLGVSFFRVRCRDYLTDQLELRRQELRRQGKNVTLSYLVMLALRKDGYIIREEDFVEDGRRLR
jgi:hypothetical protein